MVLLQSLILLLFIALLSPRTLSMRYELRSAGRKCFTEDIHANSISIGKYFIVNPNEDHPLPASHKIIVKVIPPEGKMLHEADNVESGQFLFTASETGNYVTCIAAVDHKPETTLTIDFDWKSGVHSKEWSNMAKKSQVVMMEDQVKNLMDTVDSISKEMIYLREREDEMQELNRSTNLNMAWFSFMSLGVCVSVAGLQLWHLKTFFEKKKLI